MRRWVFRIVLVLVALVVGLIGYDLINEPPAPDYTMVDRPSALDLRPAPAGNGGECVGNVRRWLVVGWDGAGWEQLLPLLDAGRLPNLARLIETGSHGDLLGFKPSLSPALWTTVATGRSPDAHGITGFDKRRHRLLQRWERLTHFGRRKRELFGNGDRRVRALWNLLDEAGRHSLIVGYHNTHPTENIRGAMVSNWLLQEHMNELMRAESNANRSFVYPAEYRPALIELARRTRAELTDQIGEFVEIGDPRSWLEDSARLGDEEGRWPFFVRRAWMFDTYNAEAALYLMPRIDAELTMVHFQSVDLALHQFLYFHQPELFSSPGWDPATLDRLDSARPAYSRTVTRFFMFLDERLGQLLQTAGPDTSVLLLSDHGFEPHTDPWSSGHHEQAPPGFWVASGPGVRQGARVDGAGLLDIFPTLAATLGLPLSDRLQGHVLRDALCDISTTSVADYEGEIRFQPTFAAPPLMTDEIERQLQSLGYLR